MLFSLNPLEQGIFVHIPKTAGNSIQKALFDSGRSFDKQIIRGHQDGVNRFEVKGQYTTHKHTKVVQYFKEPKLRSLKYFAVLRHPVDRLISLYFSPHRHLRYNANIGKYTLPDEVKFAENDFIEFVGEQESSINYLTTTVKENSIAFPLNLHLMKFDNLLDDVKSYLDLDRVQFLNKSGFEGQVPLVRGSRAIQQHIEESHHSIDLNFFF
jgi:hypothetical protein